MKMPCNGVAACRKTIQSRSRWTSKTAVALFPAFLAFLPLPALAQTYDWTGASPNSYAWTDAANWNNATVPPNGAATTNINRFDLNPVSADGVDFTGATLNIGAAENSNGALRLSGGSSFNLSNAYVGTSGTGLLEIYDSTFTASSGLTVGSANTGEVLISGSAARLHVTGANSHLNIGNMANGDGHVTIQNGAKVYVPNVSLGNLYGSGSLLVDGVGSALIIDGLDLSAAGQTGDVTIQVINGGEISISSAGSPDSRGLLQLGSNGKKTELFLTGQGSKITTTGNGLIAEFGVVNARVEGQALLDIGNHLIIADGRRIYRPTGDLVIDQGGFTRVAADTVIGVGSGHGALTLSHGGRLASVGDVYVAHGTLSRGVLNIGARAGDAPAAAGVLDAAALHFGSGDGALVFNHTANATPYGFSQQLIGAGGIAHYAGFTQLGAPDNSAFTGATTIHGGTMRIDGVLGGVMTIEAAGRLQGVGTVGATVNRGEISPGNSFGVLTIAGNYVGDGGLLTIETALGDDASPTDRLVIRGDTSGQTQVRVTNVGGAGALTREGIRIIQVDGASDGVFTLRGDYTLLGQPAVVAGAYSYTLHKNGAATPDDGDWYLRSAPPPTPTPPEPEPEPEPQPEPVLHPGAALYETMPRVALELLGVQTLQQRVGNRFWQGDASGGAPAAATEARGFWGRADGGFARLDSPGSTSGARVDQRQWRAEAGLDFPVWSHAAGALTGGVNLHYGEAFADIASPWGRGRNHTRGYGVGATATWYGASGFYADAQGRLTWFDTDLTSHTLGRKLADGAKGHGHTLSLEIGQRLHLGERLTLAPQAQLTWTGVRYDSFVDPYGSSVRFGDARSLLGRLGVALQHEQQWTDASGNQRRASLYGVLNLHHALVDDVEVSLAGLRLRNDEARTWAGIGLGGTYNLNGDAFSLYGEIQTAASLSGRGDSYRVSGKIGLRARW